MFNALFTGDKMESNIEADPDTIELIRVEAHRYCVP